MYILNKLILILPILVDVSKNQDEAIIPPGLLEKVFVGLKTTTKDLLAEQRTKMNAQHATAIAALLLDTNKVRDTLAESHKVSLSFALSLSLTPSLSLSRLSIYIMLSIH
jgi:hypothetical protein